MTEFDDAIARGEAMEAARVRSTSGAPWPDYSTFTPEKLRDREEYLLLQLRLSQPGSTDRAELRAELDHVKGLLS